MSEQIFDLWCQIAHPLAGCRGLLQLPVEVNQKKIWHLTVPHI